MADIGITISFLQSSVLKAKHHHHFTGTTIPLSSFNYSTTHQLSLTEAYCSRLRVFIPYLDLQVWNGKTKILKPKSKD